MYFLRLPSPLWFISTPLNELCAGYTQEQQSRLAHSPSLELSQIPQISQRLSTLPDSLFSAVQQRGILFASGELEILGFFPARQGGLCHLEWNRPGRNLPYEVNSGHALALHFQFLFLLPSHTFFLSANTKLLNMSRQCYTPNYFPFPCLWHITGWEKGFLTKTIIGD